MKSSTLLLVAVGLCAAAVERTSEVALTRINAAQGRAGSGILDEQLRSLYWFGKFDVGKSKKISLLIDTGSSDIILKSGIYKPSEHMKPFPGPRKHFFSGYGGVSRAGFGYEVINYTQHIDIVTGAGLSVPSQAIGTITSFTYYDTKPLPDPFPGGGDGINGFQDLLGPKPSNDKRNSWFGNLCIHKLIPSCRLGLAYGTSGQGVAVIGKLAERLLDGPLVTAPTDTIYSLQGDVYVNNELIAADQDFQLDEGTDNIQGPLGAANRIFRKLGYQTHESYPPSTGARKRSPTLHYLKGFFPCDHPPTIGFAFPPKSKLKEGQKSTVFNISQSLEVWDVYDHGHNNCTAIIAGSSASGSRSWTLGQPFFAGHYIDFNRDALTLGFANLKNPENPTA